MAQHLPHDVLCRMVRQAMANGRAFDRDVELGGMSYSVAVVPIRGEGYANIYGRDISERKRAEEALRGYAERLHFLHEVDEAILIARKPAEVARAVVQHVPRLLPCLRASVLVHHQDTRELSLLAVYASGETELDTSWHGPADASWKPVLEQLTQGKGYLVEDLQALPTTSPLMAKMQAEGVRAQVYEPIMIHGQLAGTLSLSMAEPGPLSLEQRAVVRELALQLAIGLGQTRLYEAVQRHAGELEQLVQQRTAELKNSEERFRTIFEEAALGIALMDREGRLIATNPALQCLLGYSEQELAGMSALDLLVDARRDGDELPLELLTGQRDEYALEQRYVRRDGKAGEANVTLSLLSRDAGERPLVLALVEDITERKRAQEALIQAERLAVIGRMAASLAHEINNPLQAVVGCLGLAIEALEEHEDAGMFMSVAMDELKRAARIVHRMRDLGRRQEPHKEPVSLDELLERVLILTRNQARNQQVQVVWEGADVPDPVPMVRDRIQQVFLNLVLNAIDAMPEGGELRIQAGSTAEPPGVQVSFADTGVGIASEELERVFEAFHSTKEVGLGLGLYVSRDIVEEHGGRMDVQSELGRGTTFTVWLPDASG
jgi:PAS domain S-box-containing protein